MVTAGFVAPYLLDTTTRFVEAAAGLPDTRLALITTEPADRLPPGLKEHLAGHWRVDDPLDAGQIAWAVEGLGGQLGPVQRLLAVLEQLQVPLAQVREHLGIPGMDAATARNFRDKDQMKTVLRAAGVPCARHRLAESAAAAADFAAAVGFPLVVKPPAGAGAKSTFRLDDGGDLESWLEVAPPAPDRPALIEEFLTGEEGSYDSVMVDGEIVWDSVSNYLPTPLEAMRTRWISPEFISTNRIDSAPEYAELREMGQRVINALGIGTSATHMEWFFGPEGLKFSEIGCRPPGVGAWDLYSAGNDLDIYREWANAIVNGHAGAAPSRRLATGMIALRPDRDGSISGYSGVDDLQRRYGEWVIDAHLPEPGTPTQPVAAGYMGNAYVRMRHPDYDVLRGMLDDVGRTLHVHAQ